MSFKIESIELRRIRLPLREPFRISSGVELDREILLLRLTDTSGASVWAECVAGSAPNYSPETVETAWMAIETWLAPRVLGVEFENPGALDEALNHHIRGHNMAKAALEMGSWGLEATLQGVSLSSLVGGTREQVVTGISLGIQESPEILVEKAQAALAQGYRKIKLKIQPGADVAYVGAVRAALGDDIAIMTDANSAYRLADIEILQQLDGFGLLMIEQPLAWDDLVRHAELQRLMETPICLDESITSLDRAEDMLQLGSGRIINIKPGRVGGFTTSRAIHDLCRSADVPVWCGGMLESGIGRAYNVALASLPGFTLPGDLSPSSRYWEEDVVAPEWTMDEGGLVTIPTGPGLGVEVRPERLDALTERREILSN
jgi:O-succinylbenzoate synthase